MSALSVIEQRLLHWNTLASLLPKPNKALLPIDRLNDLLKVCANSSYLRTGESIHAHLIVTDQSSRAEDVFQINSPINLYGKCGETVCARKLFDSMPARDVVSWCSMMKGYQNSGLHLEVLELFKSMLLSGESQPNEFVGSVVFKSCSSSGRTKEGKQCHEWFLKSDLFSHEFVRNTLVYMYSSCTGTREAIRILDDLPNCDLPAFSSALSGYLKCGALKEGVNVLRRMANEDLVWDNITYISSLTLCSNLRDLNLARQVPVPIDRNKTCNL